MLCEELMERLRPITEEEQQILQGSDIDRNIATTSSHERIRTTATATSTQAIQAHLAIVANCLRKLDAK